MEIFRKNNLVNGRLLSMSKSTYRNQFPDNEVYFNANIFVLGEGKVWFGDIDVTRDIDVLESISSELGKDLYILRESDGRFENEFLSESEIISKSVYKISK
jgi:hypothetical protein